MANQANDDKAQTSGASSTKKRWQLFERHRRPSVGRIKQPGAWSGWGPSGEPFGDDDYENNHDFARRRSTREIEYEVREI